MFCLIAAKMRSIVFLLFVVPTGSVFAPPARLVELVASAPTPSPAFSSSLPSP